ncbi:MAG: hypothetical protein DRJ29_16850 [Bacteroidetes bacterium]|nr:MAG: hypothetical protein DRI98_03730 [Bacteroidota bacterium]RLD88995.1 MAG: hypothetical protein DRJ29_16850 [Bacteroidota bacterium]
MKATEMKEFSILSKRLGAWMVVCLLPLSMMGQQKEVRVVKPYSPTLSGAEKIELLPSMDEQIDFTIPEISYQLYPKRYESQFRVEPIKAARMVKMPLHRLYKSQLTLGFGNYLTPLAELNINQLRSRNGTFGVHLKHHSMNGKVKLDNDLKVPAGFNENELDIYGSRFLKNSAFDYGAGASYNSYVHYGVDPELDTVLNREDAVEPYFTAEGKLGIHSMHADSFHVNYKASLEYHYFTHKFEQAEHGARLELDLDKKLRVLDLAGEFGGVWLGHYPDWDTLVGNQTIFWFNPSVSKGTTQWRFTAGVNIYGRVNNEIFKPHLYPRAMFQFHMVKEVIVPYFGVDGYLETNSYRQVVEENPYIVPSLAVRPTSHKMIGYLGLKGHISDAVSYNLKASYSIIDDAYFYVNDNSDPLMNQFRVVYDDVTLGTLHGELTVEPNDSWKVFLQGNYYSYITMVNEEHPWNKPEFDISLQARYNMGDKIILNAGIYTIGSRYYENYNLALEETLPLTFDLNLGMEYRYSKLLSFWVRFNNMTGQSYYLYNQYPSYKFRAMLGFSYAL